MLDFRLKSLDIFNHMEYPDWGPDISELDMDNIIRSMLNDIRLIFKKIF